jgi:hypothetical protein
MAEKINPLQQKIRWFIYDHFVQQARPPTIAEAAQALNLPVAQTRAIYHWLHDNHFLFLEPGHDEVRMANPFSAVPTDFRVHHVDGRRWWANCAWDALAIPAMLQIEATVEAACADCREPITLTVENEQIQGHGELIHFALPFKRWYDDLIFT